MLVQVPNNGQLRLAVLSVHDLKPHEETIPSLLNSLTSDLSRTAYQRDPLIVDEKSAIVLDGMHRLAALKALRANFAVCACFDYMDPRLELHRWLRCFVAPDRQFIDDVVGLFEFEKTNGIEEALLAVDSSKSPIALLSSEQSYVSKSECDFEEIYRRLGNFDRLATARNLSVEFHTEEEERVGLLTSASTFVLYPLAFKKEDIVHVASSHGLLPYKTTRHVVPIRPMDIYFPLPVLKQNDLNACVVELERIVSSRTVQLVKSNTLYEGRRYTEPLAIFESKDDSTKASSAIRRDK